MPDGQGKLTKPDGSVYNGEWKGGKQSGKGVQTFGDGRRAEGTF